MALEFSIGDICEKAEEGDPVAFSGEILEVKKPEDKGEGQYGPWVQQTIKVGEGQARIQYDRNLEKGDPIFVTEQEGERVRVKGAKFRSWKYKGKMYYGATGGKILEPELTELYRGLAGGSEPTPRGGTSWDRDGNGGAKAQRPKKIAPDYEDVAWGAAHLMRGIFGIPVDAPIDVPLNSEIAVAVQAGIATAIIQARQSTGLDMSRLIARGQKERLREKQGPGDVRQDADEAPPEDDAEKTSAEQAEEDKRTVTAEELTALDDLRVKHDVPRESVAAQAAQRWALKNPALMNVRQMRVLKEWIEGGNKEAESKTKFPF